MPEVCYDQAVDRIQDFSSYLKALQCEHQETWRWLYPMYFANVDPIQRFIGIPDTTKFNETGRTCFEFPVAVLFEAKSYDSLDQALKAGHEYIIDTEVSKVHIEVQRNETLVQERMKMQEKDRGNLKENLLLVHIDTISRRLMHFKMPEVTQFFKGRDHLEFFRLHSTLRRTKENAMMFMYGKSKEDISTNVGNEFWHIEDYLPPFDPENRWPQIWDDFQKAGFITGFSADTCESNVFWSEQISRRYFVNNPPDHEGIGIQCDPHVFDHLEGADQWQGPYSHFRRCIYQRDSFFYALDYARSFW